VSTSIHIRLTFQNEMLSSGKAVGSWKVVGPCESVDGRFEMHKNASSKGRHTVFGEHKYPGIIG